MRDDRNRWDASLEGPLRLEAPGLALSVEPARPRLLMMSGADALAATKLPLVPWPEIAPASGGYALPLRRDRVLEIGGPDRPAGWDAKTGLAVSDVSDGYATVSIEGPDALSLLQRGTEITFEAPSASADRTAFGLPLLIVRQGNIRLGIFTPRAHLTALWQTLAANAQAL